MHLWVSVIFIVFLDWLVMIEDIQAYDRVSQEGQEVQVDASL
jgi:hypothetical protein